MEPDPVHRIVKAGHQVGDLCVILLAGLLLRRLQAVGRLGHCQTLLDVQRPGLAVRQPVVVIEPVGHIAALLGLQNQRSPFDGVEATGVDLEKVSLMNGNFPSSTYQHSVLPRAPFSWTAA